MHPVVAPSRSSQTRSVFARFLDRVSGNGILPDVMRLMALRTSSRSAARAGATTRADSRIARRTGLADWNIWEILGESRSPPRNDLSPICPLEEVEPTVELLIGCPGSHYR